VVYSYLLLQTEKITIKDIKYSILNAIGSLLIIVSLTSAFNFPSFVIELFWVLISCIGIYKCIKRKKPDSK
jgi:hypothetical protein